MGQTRWNWLPSLLFLFLIFLAACSRPLQENGEMAGGAVLKGSSLGEPETAESLWWQQRFDEALETAPDVVEDGISVAEMSDEELEELYAEEWAYVSDRLDEVAALGLLGDSDTALKSAVAAAGARGGMSGMTCLGLGIHGEAEGESHEGKVAVGRTLMNRAGGDIKKVCAALFAKAQFESMQKRLRAVAAASVRAAQEAANKGSWKFDHFLNKVLQRRLGRRIPQWVVNFERWGCDHAQIGAHTFYASKHCRRSK